MPRRVKKRRKVETDDGVSIFTARSSRNRDEPEHAWQAVVYWSLGVCWKAWIQGEEGTGGGGVEIRPASWQKTSTYLDKLRFFPIFNLGEKSWIWTIRSYKEAPCEH